MSAQPPAASRPGPAAPFVKKPYTIWNLISITFRRFYDELGRNLLANLIWSGVIILFCFLPSWFLARYAPPSVFTVVFPILIILVAGPATAGLYAYAIDLLLWKDPPLMTLWAGFRRFYLRAVIITLVFVLICAFLAADVWICLGMIQSNPFAGTVILLLCFWAFVFLGMIHLYPMAFLVRQDSSPWTAMKRGLIVALAKPWQSLAALIVEWLLLSITALFRFLPLMIFTAVLIVLLGSVAVLCMLEEYEE